MRRLLLALALVAMRAAAQTTGSLSIELGDYRNLGYIAPLWGVAGNLEVETPRFIFAADADWSPDHKQSARVVVAPFAPEWSVAARGSALTKLGIVLLGGGPAYTITRTSEYTKDGLRWQAVAGLDFRFVDRGRLRVTGAHVFPGSDRSNDLEGERVAFRGDFPWGQRMAHRVEFQIGFWRFHESNHPEGQRYAARTWLLSVGQAF